MARAAAYAKPAETAKLVAKVVDLSAAQPKKAAATTRWGLFSAAAAVALLVGGGWGTVRGDADAADHRDLWDGGEPSFAAGAGCSVATAGPFGRVPSGIAASARTFSTKRRRLTRRGRTMRRSRGLVRR